MFHIITTYLWDKRCSLHVYNFLLNLGHFSKRFLSFNFTVEIMGLKRFMVFLGNSFQSNNNVTNPKYRNGEELQKFRYFSFMVNLPHLLSPYLAMLAKGILLHPVEKRVTFTFHLN